MSPASSWSPIRGQLILSNLPPQIRPSQIRKILTLLPPPDGPAVLKPRDPELEVVQVYLKPVKEREHQSGRRWRFGKGRVDDRDASRSATRAASQNTDMAKRERIDRASSGRRPRAHAHGAEQPVDRTTTRVQEVADDGEPDGDAEVVPEAPPAKSTGDTAIAYLYFRNEYARWEAEMAFRALTIDGRKVQVDAKRVDIAPLRRLWAKMH